MNHWKKIMNHEKKVRIGCASAFWGDTTTAAKQLVEKSTLDYLVFDFLAEVTMSILAGAKKKNTEMGYATDFVEQLAPLLSQIKEKNITVLSNAGGLNLNACRKALMNEAEKAGIDLNIALVIGDDLMEEFPRLMELGVKEIETNHPLPDPCLSINAYLGAPGIVAALEQGADIIITGRCVDSAMVLAPLIYEFGWTMNDYDLLAAGSLAGHIIECGAQCTGGNFTDWRKVDRFDNMGFPIVEVEPNGQFIVTKPKDTGGMVTFGTVAEQFLYEIGNPSEYLLPDVVCDFTQVTIDDLGDDRVLVKGALGSPPTDVYKVSATYMDGYRVVGTLIIGGHSSKKKGELISEAIIKKCDRILSNKGFEPFSNTSYDLVGTDSIYGPERSKENSKEILLRLVATHSQKDALVILSKEMAQAATGMAAGVMNYLGGRPSVSSSIHLYSFLFPKDQVPVGVDINDQLLNVDISCDGGFVPLPGNQRSISGISNQEMQVSVPLIKLAFARSGDKGDHANIGVIARRPEFLPFIQNALTPEAISKYFDHVIHGEVMSWDVPGINGINFLLKNSLGGGGMSSLNIDPQGKSYAQQLLDHEIPISDSIAKELD